jgi:hypothetical protein
VKAPKVVRVVFRGGEVKAVVAPQERSGRQNWRRCDDRRSVGSERDGLQNGDAVGGHGSNSHDVSQQKGPGLKGGTLPRRRMHPPQSGHGAASVLRFGSSPGVILMDTSGWAEEAWAAASERQSRRFSLRSPLARKP